MNIIYVIEDFSSRGGAERIVSEKANTLSTLYNHKVTIISLYHDNRPQAYKLDDNVNLLHLDIPFAKKTNNHVSRLINRLIVMIIAIKRINKALRQLNPDIIFFTTTLGAILLPFCCTKARKIYESHTSKQFNPFHQLFFLTELMADTIVCLTEDDRNNYHLTKNCIVIPNYVCNISKYVNDYGVKKAITVGRLEYVKGFDILIECWKEIAKQYPDWQLDIYGEGSCREELQQQIDSLELGDKVKLCGRNDNIIEVYPKYSLHLMTSRYEGLPMTLIEAQACGLPSVVFNFQYGASDIITNEYNGLIIEQGNSKRFINAVNKMMLSEVLRKEYGKNAIIIGKRYSKINIFNKWIQLTDNIASMIPFIYVICYYVTNNINIHII